MDYFNGLYNAFELNKKEEVEELLNFISSFECTNQEEEFQRDVLVIDHIQEMRARRLSNLTGEEVLTLAKECIDYAIVGYYFNALSSVMIENETLKELTGKEKDLSLSGNYLIKRKPDDYHYSENTHKFIISRGFVLDSYNVSKQIESIELDEYKKALTEKEYIDNLLFYLTERVKSWELLVSEFIESLGEPTNMVEILEEEKNPILRNQSYIPSYHGKATDNFAYMSGTAPTHKSKTSKTTKFEYDGTTINISDFSKNSLSINPHKLLSVAMGEFTANNTYFNPYSKKKRSGNVQYRTSFSEDDYYKACGLDVDIKPTSTQEEAEREEKRAKNAKKSARKRLKSDLETLLNSKVYFTEKGKNGELKNFSGLNYIGGYSVKDGIITITLSVDLGDYLLSKPITQYPTALLGVDSRNENAYNLGLKMSEYYNLDNNVITGQYNRLKVETLLKVMRIDIDDVIKNDSRHWDRRIKEPLENALDHLVEKGVLTVWEYVKTKGEPIPDNEAYIETYEEYKNLLVHFELRDAPSQQERLERRKNERIEAKEATTKKKKTDKKKD